MDASWPISGGGDRPIRRLDLERTWGHLIAAVLSLTLGIVFVGTFCALAIHNLLSHRAIIQSGIWLLLVAIVMTIVGVSEGPRKLAVEFLGIFARSHFIAALDPPNENDAAAHPSMIAIGFGWSSFQFHYLKIRMDAITSVDCSPDQFADRIGSLTTGWKTWIWYKPKDHREPREEEIRPGEDCFAIGFGESKQDAERLGRRLMDFLGQFGVEFAEAPAHGRTEYERIR